jgi:hypothetical protein
VSENTDPLLGRDELMDLIAAQVAASQTAASVAEVAAKLSPDATMLVAEIENDLVTAERFSKPRASLGRAKIPGKNTPIERLLLRLHSLIFRDQRNTDAALIAALRKSLQLNIRLAAEYATLFEQNAKPKSADADIKT